MNVFEKICLLMVDNGFSFRSNRFLEEQLNLASEIKTTKEKTIIAEQHGKAEKIFILVSGQATFIKKHEDKSSQLAKLTKTGTPLGVSGLHPPERYMADIILSPQAEYISINTSILKDIERNDPENISLFYSYLLLHSVDLVWSSRNLDKAYVEKEISISDGIKTGEDSVNFKRLRDAAFLAFLDNNDLEKLVYYGSIKLFSANEYITTEGSISDGINILISGKIDATFTSKKNDITKTNTRTIARAGVALSLSAGLYKIQSPYSLKATRDTKILKFSNEFIDNLIKTEPILALKFLKRQLWQIGRYIQSSSGLTTYPAKNEIEFCDFLLKDNSSRIPVDSKLFNLPHLLKNHLTHSLAFDIVYESLVTGNDNEKALASLMIDVLTGLERKYRFFVQLNKIYDRVSSSNNQIDKAILQKLTNADFIKAFDQVPYVIKGMENLPDEPTNIYFYNHIAKNDENTLANGHSFSIDSHFISAKILFPKYGDGGQRIARQSRNTEFMRYNYYENLDYIFVHTPESDYLKETSKEKKKRKEKLFVETQDVFNQNRPLVIAPEGTNESEDNKTPNSPGEFKPGAFLLANRLDPEPKLIPIALANFDYSISKTIYAAVIKKPIKIKDHIKDFEDKEEINKFLNNYRKKFKKYVEEAIELAQQIENDNQLLDKLNTNINLVSPVEEQFESDIRELEINMHNEIIANKKVILYGSSTFKYWEKAKQDLSINNLLNLGFGGSTLVACRAYFHRVVVPQNPDTMFFYGGDNDIGGGMSAEELYNEFLLFTSEIQEKLPHTRCYFVSIKPSVFRENYMDVILESNAKIRDAIKHLSQWKYIDLSSPMLETGFEKFYDDDPLHMNVLGYSLLSKLMRDELSLIEQFG